jgi:hypothetical protein
MTIDPQSAEPRGRRFSFYAELDRLVAQELEALVTHKQSAARVEKSDPEEIDTPPEGEADIDEAQGPADAPQATEPEVDRVPSEQGKVIGFARASAKNGAPVLPFSPQEEAFIENAVAFLRHLPNRDLIVEEIWLLTANREEEFTDMEDAEAAEQQEEPNSKAEPEP